MTREGIPETQFISNEDHYEKVIERIKNVKKVLWIGTADIKDLYVRDIRGMKPLLKVLSDLVKNGVEIRLIHAKEPGPAFREDFDKYPVLIKGMERVLCPRVHFKIIIFDLKTAYIGSANLTGAGLGMKGVYPECTLDDILFIGHLNVRIDHAVA